MDKIMACPPAGDSIVKEPECEDVVINIPPPEQSKCFIDMASSFRARIKEPECEDVVNNSPPPEESKCCIYRVPKQLRKVNKESYTPKHVSIGPFHHRRKELSGMKIHKQRYSDYFFQRLTLKKNKENLLEIIKEKEENIRNCYSDECRLKGEEFANMILLDAIFIIELFLKEWELSQWEREKKMDYISCKPLLSEWKEKMDYISSKPWLAVGIKHDLILLENQLPFFVLEDLYMSSGCNHCEEGEQIDEHKKDLKKHGIGEKETKNPSFVDLSLHYFSRQHGMGKKGTKNPTSKEVKHFIDLLRYLFCSSVPDHFCTNKRPLHTRYSAKKLADAGLKFKAAEKKPLLKIQFYKNRCRCFKCSCLLSCLPCFPFLEVPCLQIDDYTEAFFRNLMALEQCHYPYNAYICNYVMLLDRLINTEEDVDLLVKKKVIDNMLGSNAAVATLINKLGDQIVVTPSPYFDDIAQNLNAHYEFIWYQIWATLKREYFPNIFRGTATILGLIVLGFTLWSFIRPYVMKT